MNIKYQLDNSGVQGNFSGTILAIWWGVCATITDVKECAFDVQNVVLMVMGNENDTFFWTLKWLRDSAFMLRFPTLCAVFGNLNAKILETVYWNKNSVGIGPYLGEGFGTEKR